MLTEQEYVSAPEENYQWYDNGFPRVCFSTHGCADINMVDLLNLDSFRGYTNSMANYWESIDLIFYKHEHQEVFREDSYCDGSCQHNLQLAAELGKTLLERNKDLENQIKLAHQSSHDQQREIDLLTKQLEALRGVSDSRMKIYEEVDRNLQDAERRNETFKKESRSAKAKVDELNAVVEAQEARIEELTTKIESMHQRERQSRSRASRRTQSVPSLADADEYGSRCGAGFEEYRGFIPDSHHDRRISAKEMKGLRTLQESIRNLKQQLATEARKRSNIENDMSELVRENETLQVRVTLLEQEEKKIKKLEAELEEVAMRAEKLCAQCGKSLETTRLMRKPEMSVEHDDLQEIPNGEFVRLKNGGSAYGSRESLNTLGLELETPIDEQLVTIFNTMNDGDTSPHPENNDSLNKVDRRSLATSPGEERCGSLLGELEDQYRSLVKKYETLIDAKSKRAESLDAATQKEDAGGSKTAVDAKRPSALPLKGKAEKAKAKARTTATKKTTTKTKDTTAKPLADTESTSNLPSSLDFTSPLDPTEGRFENGPPEYKRLFREIFETLRRSIAEDDDLRYIQEPAVPERSQARANKPNEQKTT